MHSNTWSRKVLAGAFTLALVGAATTGAGLAVADEVGPPAGIDLTLEVVAQGELSMSVDTSQAVVLGEEDPEGANRIFTGTLPTVTVTDTRSDIPEGFAWSVVANASEFVHEDDAAVTIATEHLGWTPRLVDEPVDDENVVDAGTPVEPAADGGPGLSEGFELLMLAEWSDEAQAVSQAWKATADLKLAAPADELVTGNYNSTLTLSLFEQDFGTP